MAHPADALQTDFAGTRGRLFLLALKTSVLTVLTLGLYRFWMKTRLRRYYWSAIRPGGHPLEYVGEPLEKLLGFLIAVVFLAFYIGIANLVLMFLSFSLLGGNFAAYLLSFIGVIPLLFYAQYRARRYVLARTRWRGIRFGLDPGAWGYAWRAMVHWTITLLTAGLLWPRMTFWLEKYRTDRTRYGTLRLRQGGGWKMLYPPFLPLLAGIALGAAGIGGAAAGTPEAAGLLALAVPLSFYGWVNYRVKAFKRLTETKTAGGVSFIAEPRRWRVLGIYLWGTFMIGVGLLLLLVSAGYAAALILGLLKGGGAGYDILEAFDIMPAWLSAALGVGVYFAFFIFWGVLRHVFLNLPLMRHYAETLRVAGAVQIGMTRQRGRDEFREAEGFAEALDVGAAI